MFPAQIPRTSPDKLIRCRDSSQSMPEEKTGHNEDAKADAALAHEVKHALWKDDVLRAVEYNEIDVHVKKGVVYLHGHIVSTTSQSRIENAFRTIPGILGIKNNLVLDDRLTLEVATSLGQLEHTYDCKFFTGTSHGVVSLNGIVRDEAVKLLAEQYAASIPNVRAVINNVRVSGSESGLQVETFLQPAIGETIYFLDGVSGVVKQVIINPNNRRVTAMTVQGNFTDQRYKLNSLTDDKARPPEQLVIVPMNVVRYLTKVSGFLFINSNERNRYMDLDPASFIVPNSDWVPPYPYCPDNVLFPVEYQEADIQNVYEPQLMIPFAVISEDASVGEQLIANDSLGG